MTTELTQATTQASKPKQLMAFSVRNEGETLSLDVYESIGESFWGDSISARDVLGKLRDAKPKSVKVRINSGGGDLFDGIAIHNLLRASGATIEVSVDGVAASAASVIAIAADPGKLSIAQGAFLMIHEARGGVFGTASELDGAAKLIRKANATMADMYSKAAASRGIHVDPATFAALMAEETWFNGEEAKLIGLADSIGETPALAASIDLSAFGKAPQELTCRIASATEFTVPKAAPTESAGNMDLKTMQAAIEAKDAELVALKARAEKAEADASSVKSELAKAQTELSASNAKLEASAISLQALTTQNEKLAAERDQALADISARDAKLLEAEVDALIPNILDSAERDNFVALAKASRPLFDSMVAQRKPRNLTAKLVDTDLSQLEANASVGADTKFDELVSKDLT